MVRDYDHTAFTAWLDEENLDKGKTTSRRNESGKFEGYLYHCEIMDSIKRAIIESIIIFEQPYLLHLTIFLNEEYRISGFFNALGMACKRELGFRPIYVAAIEKKHQRDIEGDGYQFRDDGFHYQCAILIEYSDSSVTMLKKIIKRQIGKSLIKNRRAARLTGGHFITRSKRELLLGIKHLGGYVSKVHRTKPENSKTLKRWAEKEGHKNNRKRFISSRLRKWDAIELEISKMNTTGDNYVNDIR